MAGELGVGPEAVDRADLGAEAIRLGRVLAELMPDEPEAVGGDGSAPSPHELLPAALAGCISTTLVMYARTKEWELGDVAVDAYYHSHESPQRLEVEISHGGALSEEPVRRFENVAASCPVQRSLTGGAVFEERIASAATL